MNYYNEIEPSAIAWLKELIKAGEIPDGHIDTRSIADVRPEDLDGFTQCHFFAGIAGWPLALRLAGYADTPGLWTGSCPCQPFSAAGKRKGTSDARHLWPEMRRLVEQCRPAIVLGEQVASKDGRTWCAGVRADMEALGYAFGAADLCAAGVGAPHIRQRLYWGGCRGVVNATGEQVGISRQPREQRDAGGLEHTEGGGREGEPIHANRNAEVRIAQTDARGLEHTTKQRRHEQRRPEGAAVQGQRAERGREQEVAGRDGELSGRPEGLGADTGAGVEHAPSNRRQQRGAIAGERSPECGRGEGGGGLADTDKQQQHGLGDAGPRGRGELADDGRLGHANNQGSQGHGNTGERTRELSPWSASTLIHCADGKTRRICPESQFQHVVDGLPHVMEYMRASGVAEKEINLTMFPLAANIVGRVGLLRGYGNAIVPQLAEAFITSFMEAITDAR